MAETTMDEMVCGRNVLWPNRSVDETSRKLSQLAVLWERGKTQSIAFGSSVVAPKRCTGHHLELLAILPTWMFVLVC